LPELACISADIEHQVYPVRREHRHELGSCGTDRTITPKLETELANGSLGI